MKKIEKEFTFRKTKGNGDIGGTTQPYLVPKFNWEEFKNTPNANLFIRKAYYSSVQKIVRDIKLNLGNTTEDDIQSMESVIAHSLTFTSKEIKKWCESRDWSEADPEKKLSDKQIKLLIEKLPRFSNSGLVFYEKQKIIIANIIASVADREIDDIAEYLWVKLTQKSFIDDLNASDF